MTERSFFSVLLFLWPVASFIALFVLERQIHKHLQLLGYGLVGNDDWAIRLYRFFFLPGIALHEIAHWLTAKLMGVTVGRISLWPKQQPDNIIRLGYAEVARTGPIRSALISTAPLLFGAVALLLIGNIFFNLNIFIAELTQGNVAQAWQVLTSNLSWWSALWAYLMFAIANSMMPSPPDWRLCRPVMPILIGGIMVFLIISMIEPSIMGIAVIVFEVLAVLATAWTLAAVINLMLLPGIMLVEQWVSIPADKTKSYTPAIKIDDISLITTCPQCGQRNRIPYECLRDPLQCSSCRTRILPS